MKALTIEQPFATLISTGGMHIYTLGWQTDYRGPLAIHAAAVFSQRAKDLLGQPPFQAALGRAGYRHWLDLPTGTVIAVARLEGCSPAAELGSEQELVLGETGPESFAWRLSNLRMLPQPAPARDRIGLWDWAVPAELADLLELAGLGEDTHQYHGSEEALAASALR